MQSADPAGLVGDTESPEVQTVHFFQLQAAYDNRNRKSWTFPRHTIRAEQSGEHGRPKRRRCGPRILILSRSCLSPRLPPSCGALQRIQGHGELLPVASDPAAGEFLSRLEACQEELPLTFLSLKRLRPVTMLDEADRKAALLALAQTLVNEMETQASASVPELLPLLGTPSVDGP